MADEKNEPAPVKAPEVGSREWHDRIEEKSWEFFDYLMANPEKGVQLPEDPAAK